MGLSLHNIIAVPYLNFTQCLPSDVYTEARKVLVGADGEREKETITVYGCGGVVVRSIMEQVRGKSRTGGGSSSIGSLWWRSYQKVEFRLDRSKNQAVIWSYHIV